MLDDLKSCRRCAPQNRSPAIPPEPRASTQALMQMAKKLNDIGYINPITVPASGDYVNVLTSLNELMVYSLIAH